MHLSPNHKANAVLSIALDQAKDHLDWYVEPYVNGREIGWSIASLKGNRKVAFSENRNSDAIVVYCGCFSDFSMQGNAPNEKTWKASESFSHDDYLKAAQRLIGHGEQMTQPKWKRGDLVRTTARLMFGKVVIPQGTEIRIQKHEVFSSECLAYEGNAILPTGLHLCYPLWVEDLEEVT